MAAKYSIKSATYGVYIAKPENSCKRLEKSPSECCNVAQALGVEQSGDAIALSKFDFARLRGGKLKQTEREILVLKRLAYLDLVKRGFSKPGQGIVIRPYEVRESDLPACGKNLKFAIPGSRAAYLRVRMSEDAYREELRAKLDKIEKLGLLTTYRLEPVSGGCIIRFDENEELTDVAVVRLLLDFTCWADGKLCRVSW